MEKRVIVTVATGRYEEIKDIISPRFTNYAATCKAHFVYIGDSKYPDCPVLDKFRITELFDAYDRVLFLDADILVRNDCPSLFDLVKPGKVAAFDEASTLWNWNETLIRFMEIAKLCALWKLESVNCENTRSHYNAGVVLYGKEHKVLFDNDKVGDLPNPIGKALCSEQMYMNWAIMKNSIPMHSLPVCFNQMPYNRFPNYRETSYMIHYAGLSFDQRLLEMKQDDEYWKQNSN